MVKAYIQLIAYHKAQANADIIHEKLSASVMHMSKCYAKWYVHKDARKGKKKGKPILNYRNNYPTQNG